NGGGAVEVEVTADERLNRLNVRIEPAMITKIKPTMPPRIHGSQSFFFCSFNLKSAGTAIRTTVMLSCPPRELASSISALAASLRLDFERTTSSISSFHTRSVKPSLHNKTTSLGCRGIP